MLILTWINDLNISILQKTIITSNKKGKFAGNIPIVGDKGFSKAPQNMLAISHKTKKSHLQKE